MKFMKIDSATNELMLLLDKCSEIDLNASCFGLGPNIRANKILSLIIAELTERGVSQGNVYAAVGSAIEMGLIFGYILGTSTKNNESIH